ncbi:MAG: M13 family metallopeptidase [Myxococcales bacterium]|nr:M13 family metallopeptidase [Myxococcales bacterium]
MKRSLLALAVAACSSPATNVATTPAVAPAPAAVPGLQAAPTSPASSAPVLHGVYLDDLDRSVAPCTDFFEYGNGSWRKANPIPASMARWSRRWKSGEDAKGQLREILDQVAAKRDWKAGSVEQLIGDFYVACMDEAKADQLGAGPIVPMLGKIAAIKDRAGVVAMIGDLDRQGIPVPLAVNVQSDLHTPTEVVATVAAAGLGLPDRDYYEKPEKRFADARAKYVVHVAKLLQLAGVAEAAAKQQAKATFDLETKLAKASLDNVALRDPRATDHKMSVGELQKLSPAFDWTKFLGGGHLPVVPLNVEQPTFVKEVQRQLTRTSIADWKSYLAFHYLDAMALLLSKPFVDEQFEFNDRFLQGVQEQKPRWKRCAELTDGLLGEALGQKYVEKYFPPPAKARMKTLVDNVLLGMKETIEHLDWMTDATRKKALEKLATVNTKIGYPDKWKDYSAIPIRADAMFDNVIAARTWNLDDDRKTVGKPVDRGRWGMTPPTSNAYYNPSLNEIVFPAGILQPPIFTMDAVDAINYGAIGVIIGHEISHGFDDQGAQFDAQGRLENWWSPDDLKAFQAKGKCIVDQFESYFIEPGIHHNGKLVLGESIGDSGGANVAYRAFQIAQRTTPAATVDGFTPDQQFFIAWAQARGDAIRIEEQRRMVQGDPHPIGKFRVMGPLSNMPEFATAFSCKPGTAMVRAQPCRVW